MKAFTVGFCVIELYMPQCHSLKEKRQLIRRVKSKVQNKFDVVIAEVGEQNRWKNAVLGVTTLSSDQRVVNSVLDQVLGLVMAFSEAEVTHHYLELI
ncbi:MAG: DUF503 domain-containing protein [Nitrospiria bacterium]